MDEVFRALAHPSRRQLLDSLNARNGQTLRELYWKLEMARQSVSKHLAILEAANLEPSPIAVETRLTDPLLTSPTQNTPR